MFLPKSEDFQAEGVWINWSQVALRMGLRNERLASDPIVHLRWMINPQLGLPTEPFIVWRRPVSARSARLCEPVVLSFDVSTLEYLFNASLLDWRGKMAVVEIDVDGAEGFVVAFVGVPSLTTVVAFAYAPGGERTLYLNASSMEGLVASPGIKVNEIRGITVKDLKHASGWKEFERVGLPVPSADGTGIGNIAADQGMSGALTTPMEAAKQRLERGAPPIGWGPQLESGVPAPTWSPPDFKKLIQEVNDDLLDDIREIINRGPPKQQHEEEIWKDLPPPQNNQDKYMPDEQGTEIPVKPLSLLLMAAGTDPHLALALGFGTAYPDSDKPKEHTMVAVAFNPYFDYKITARWECGLDGRSEPFEMATLVPFPAQAFPPPLPGDTKTEMMGHLRPQRLDADWLCSVRVSWDRPWGIPLFHPRTYAFAYAGVAPAEPSRALMNKRVSGGFLPITIVDALECPDNPEPEPNRLHAIHRELQIPTNPGWRKVKYAVAHQDIYGQWSNWKTVDSTVGLPPVDQVAIINVQFNVTVPPSGTKCAASLMIEFLWDWTIRSPKKILFRGILYKAKSRGDPPLHIKKIPVGFQRSLGVAGDPIEIAFTGDIPSSKDSTVIGLNPDGDKKVYFGLDQGAEVRRYRITVPGFSLNFANTGHIGCAVWAMGQERIDPQRPGDWSKDPTIVSASDPRPPVIVPDIVTLASLPDASGECHARLSWENSPPGAAGYFVYESTETRIRQAINKGEPAQELTLSERLTVIKDSLKNNAPKLRREFTRRNASLIDGKSRSTDVTLPRGSTTIHVFVILGVSAGQVEANWPSGEELNDNVQAIAAPRILAPAEPTIEAQSFLDTTVLPPVYRAKITIGERKGVPFERIDLHRVRVDDAARALDTMGPPVQVVSAVSTDWAVKVDPRKTKLHIGIDTPEGSWKRVWYRAAAWSKKDETRGILAGKSPASTACWVVIPPALPPTLSSLVVEKPKGGALGDILVTWNSPAPLQKTPLGPHRISIHASVVGDPDAQPMIVYEGPLSGMPEVMPATGSGVSRKKGVAPLTEYHALLRRGKVRDRVKFSVRITDPLGRTSEQLETIVTLTSVLKPVLTKFVFNQKAMSSLKILSWSSSSPITENEAGVYTLRVTAVPPKMQLLRGMSIPKPPITIELRLGDVPLAEPDPISVGKEPLSVRRKPGTGPAFTYVAFCQVPVTHFIVRLTAPDGKFVEHIERVS